MIGTYIDITERKLADEKIRFLASRQEAILAAVPDIIMEVDNKFYTWANKSGFEFFGNDVIGKEANSFFEGKQDTYQLVQPLLDGKENDVNIESWQRRKDGEKRLLSWWCRVLKDVNGNVTGVLSSALDITERNLAEQGLRPKSEEKYRNIFENVQDVYFETTVDGTIIDVSPSIAIVSKGQYSRDDLIGKSMYEFYSDTSLRDTLISQIKERGNISDFEIIIEKTEMVHKSLVLFRRKSV